MAQSAISFGAMLARLQRECGLTDQEVVVACRRLEPRVRGISPTSLSQWRLHRRGRMPTLAQLVVLLRVFNVEPMDWMTVLRLAVDRDLERRCRNVA